MFDEQLIKIKKYLGQEVKYQITTNNQIYIDSGILQRVEFKEGINNFPLAYIGSNIDTNFCVSILIVQDIDGKVIIE
jgi:hypothetical protein